VAAVRLLVTGSAGLLGGAVIAAAQARGWDVVPATRHDADVRDAAAVARLLRAAGPDAIVHCAYVRDGEAAWATIVDGSAHVARAAAQAGARLVHLSSERVFGGRDAAYTEADRPDPVDPYGAAKAAAEAEVLAACPSAILVRTSLLWRLDPPSELVRAVVGVVEGGAPTAFFVDEIRCPTHVDDVAAACLRLAARPELSGPLHLAGPVPLSRYDFARAVAAAMGRDPDAVRAGHLADHPAPRPARVVLDSSLAGTRLAWSPSPPPGGPRSSPHGGDAAGALRPAADEAVLGDQRRPGLDR
jgi:dTDP-4-dehydrorhamnose reductase